MDLRKQQTRSSGLRKKRESQDRAVECPRPTTFNLPFITADASGTEAHPENAHARQDGAAHRQTFERTIAPVKACLKDANIEAAKIDELVLVGGHDAHAALSSRPPHTLVNKAPHQGVNPDEVVAIGAAIQAGVLKGEVKGCGVARCDTVVARYRGLSAGFHQSNRAQHDNPDPQGPNFSTCGRQPARRGNSCLAG